MKTDSRTSQENKASFCDGQVKFCEFSEKLMKISGGEAWRNIQYSIVNHKSSIESL